MGAWEEARWTHFLIHIHHGEIDFHHWGRQLHKLPTQQSEMFALLAWKIWMLTIQHDEASNCRGCVVTVEGEVFSQFSVARLGLWSNRLVKAAANY